MMLIQMAVFLVFGYAMFIAAWKDLTSYTIPNWLSLWLIGGFLLVAPFCGLTWPDFGMHIVCMLGTLLVTMGMFAFGWIGGGDAKFFAATSIWWLPDDLLFYTVYTGLFGGVLAILLLAVRNSLPHRIRTTGWVERLLRHEKKMPYGLALAAAGLAVIPTSSLILGLS